MLKRIGVVFWWLGVLFAVYCFWILVSDTERDLAVFGAVLWVISWTLSFILGTHFWWPYRKEPK